MHPTTRHRIDYPNLVRAELTKIVTHPVIPRVLLTLLVVNTALCALAVADNFRLSGSQGPVRLSDLGGVMFAPVYLFLVIPAYAAANEFISGQYRITLTAMPDRRRLVTAKLLSLGLVMGPAAVLSLLPGRLLIAASQNLNLADTLGPGALEHGLHPDGLHRLRPCDTTPKPRRSPGHPRPCAAAHGHRRPPLARPGQTPAGPTQPQRPWHTRVRRHRHEPHQRSPPAGPVGGSTHRGTISSLATTGLLAVVGARTVHPVDPGRPTSVATAIDEAVGLPRSTTRR